MKGWIALHRKLLDWEWWDDHNTTRLFIYLLLKANHDARQWKGKTIERGQLITGLNSLQQATGISVQSLRTSLDRLISTNEITKQSTSRYSLITINRYNDYQQREYEVTKQSTSKVTNNQQATNKQVTTNNNVNNVNNDKKYKQIRSKKFESFWEKYPRKVSKKKAKQKYLSILKEDIELHKKIMKGLNNHLPLWKQTEAQFIPHPTTWLNGERWNDKVDSGSKKRFASESSDQYKDLF